MKDRILPLFMIAWLGGLLPACVYDDEDAATRAEKTDGFNISIAISAGEASTARDEELPEEGGIGAENYININDLQIYAFSTDDNNTLLAQVYPKPDDSDVAMNPSVVQIGNMYYLKAELSYDTFSKSENQTFKLVAVANGNTTDVTNNWDSLMGATYSYTVTDNTSWIPQWGNSGIPMFGVQEVSLSGYNFKTNNEFNPYTLNNVNMLRAMAKIEVVDQIADEYDVQIASVSASSYHTKGYFAPLPSEIQEETTDVKEAHIPVNPGLIQGQSLLFQHLEEENKFVAYLPEYSFATTSRDIITLKVNDVDYTLSVSPYRDGKPTEEGRNDYPWQALLRNHIYRYTVTG
ncbi:hypothetical protein, partial [Phocaeicola sp.]|uniref:hypothetical protein n=1 Tax=Phocaeicola sp. TaxID=2773926 RepID=UPI0023C16B9F